MIDYVKIIELNQEFADAHEIIKNFGNGSDFDMVLHNQEAPYRYPIMWMEDLPSPIVVGLESFSFRVVFLAQVEQLENQEEDFMLTNFNDVKSEMKKCGIDFLSYWKQVASQLYPTELRFNVATTWNWLEDATADRLYGGYFEISFNIPQTFNKCIIPIS